MNAEQRKKIILETLGESPISASTLATQLLVSRQIIVGDIALLRASGHNITATPRGYIMDCKNEARYTVVCRHTPEQLRDELYCVVDCGCGFVDVIVEHPVYGQMTGNLHIYSRVDADDFCQKLVQEQAEPLCRITNHVHIHTLDCPSDKHFAQAKEKLHEAGFLLENTACNL